MTVTPLNKVNKNFYANAIGPISINIINILAIPMYLKYAGSEAYGLIGLFASMQAFITFFFNGLGTAFNREISKLYSLKDKGKDIANLIATLTRTYFLVSLFIMCVLIIASVVAAQVWITNSSLSIYIVTMSLTILSISMFFSMFTSFYINGLLGIQSHIIVNILSISHSLIRAIFGIAILIIFNGNIILFFTAFGFASFFNMLLCRYFFLKNINLDKNIEGKFVKEIFKNNIRLTSSIAAIGLTAMIITQMDKILLSGMLSLDQFGLYVIAGTFGIAILHLSSSIYNTFFPRLVQLYSNNRMNEYNVNFRLSCKLVSIIVWPISFGIILFGNELLYFWLGDLQMVNSIYYLVCFITIGCALNGVLSMIYMITIVHGNPKIFLYQNIIIIFLMPFLLFFLVKQYGVIGASVSWMLINLFSFIVMPFLTNSYVAKVNIRAWFLNDNLIPASFSFLFIWLFSSINFDFDSSLLSSIFALLVISSCTILLALQSDIARNFIFKPRKIRS